MSQKATYWSRNGDGEWKIITQQDGNKPGVRVDINPATRSGSGSYPVWKYESNGTTPYGYRIRVTSFVYPDGTIVPASNVVTQDVAWSDNVYTATVQDVDGGKKFGTLDGAYIGDNDLQKGTLNAVITMDLHNVTFDAKGGKVNGHDSQTVTEQYKIPSFKGYVPTREGGYTFGGWYLEEDCINAATEGADLNTSNTVNGNITLYAKWIEPLTISGTVSIAGTYDQNGVEVSVNDIDRATEAVVVLQELRDGHIYEVDSQTVKFEYGQNKNAATDYSFTGIPNQGKSYQIYVLELNYSTAYDNESDTDSEYTPGDQIPGERIAEFDGDNVADVDVLLTFVPPAYNQPMQVDATQIGEGFRPSSVLAEVMYRDTGDNHPFKRISQHNVDPFGVEIPLNDNGNGTDTQSIWKWHTDGKLYDYQMNISMVDSVAYDSDTAPYYITYAAPTYWNADTDKPSGDLVATLIPKKYLITYDLNAEGDEVTGVDKLSYKAEDGTVVTTDIYGVIHTWSFDTPITAEPKRTGYTFLGWETTADNVTTDAEDETKIGAAVCEEVVLKAKWEKITYVVTAEVAPSGGGTTEGAGTYDHGASVTLTAAAAPGYTFVCWKENGTPISNDETLTIGELTSKRDFVAEFSLNQYLLTTAADPVPGGTTTGDGNYSHGTEVTLTATANPGYTFVGWVNGGEVVSQNPSFKVTVIKSTGYVANFEKNVYQVTAKAEDGGTAEGTAEYHYGDNATVTAKPNAGYTFEGWFEDGKKVSDAVGYQFEVTGNTVLTATFKQNVYQVTAKAEDGGTAEGTAEYHYGDSATVKATVDATFTFDGWYEGMKKVSGDLEYTFTVDSDRELTAKFTKNRFNIQAKPEDPDFGSTSGSGYYDQGSTATVTATPKEGYKFQGWYEGATLVSSEESYEFVVGSNRNLIAEFTRVYNINAVATPAAGGTVSGSGQYEPTATASITASANDGYYFVGWYNEANELVTTGVSHSLTVLQDRTFTAKFEKMVSYTCDYVYIFGYNDTQIGATGPLLRGELSQMIYRLVKQNNKGVSNGSHSFDDTAGQWFESGISYMAQVGAIDRTKANAYPLASVNRGETYKMICLGLDFTDDTELNYSDYAAILRNSGHLEGDGNVTGKISRWEFCELFNAILGRSNYCMNGFIDTDGNEVTAETYRYTDLNPSDRYYRTMMIATSTFDGDRIDLVNRMKRNTYDFTN